LTIDKSKLKHPFQTALIAITLLAVIISACSAPSVTKKQTSTTIELEKWLLPANPSTFSKKQQT
jgi:PBP1b-binding outer membrane lipoprotein LpoB